ncbi:MAG: type IV pilus modification protein PilV [Ramlibacter sp.]
MTRGPRRLAARRQQAGATLIEILVSLVILLVGLLGLIGVMIQSQRAQLESYQRVQALLIVQDMVARINANRVAADCYVQAGALGTGNSATPDASGCAVGNIAQKARATQDLTQWQNLLLGSSEKDAASNNVGTVLGARGCITKDATTGIFQVSVVWQGIQVVGAPPAGVTCGQGTYADDTQRRAVSVTVLPPTAS